MSLLEFSFYRQTDRQTGSLGVGLTVSSSKLLHESVNLLCLSRQTELGEEEAKSGHKVHSTEVYLVNVSIHDRLAVAVGEEGGEGGREGGRREGEEGGGRRRREGKKRKLSHYVVCMIHWTGSHNTTCTCT